MTGTIAQPAEWQRVPLPDNPDLQVFGESVANFARERLTELANEADANDALPAQVIPELSRQGYLRLGLPVELTETRVIA